MTGTTPRAAARTEPAAPLPGDRVLVVAEIGNNHEGDPDAARALVRAAAGCGCDGVKLQVFRADDFVRPDNPDRLAQMRRFQLPDAVVAELCELGRELGMLVIATPLGLAEVDLLAPRVDALKIASGDNDHLPLIRRAAAVPVPLVISTGLADMAVVERAVAAVLDIRDGDPDPGLWLLQCTSAYPAMPEDAHLAAMWSLRESTGLPVGFSDHTAGTEVAVLAAAAGARMIEKHFTLDHRTSAFRDHQLSADPQEMRRLVAQVRWVERVLGDPVKRPLPAEEPLMTAARRSPVADRDIAPGEVLTEGDLTWMRPRDGMRPGDEWRLLGGRMRVARVRGEAVTEDHVSGTPAGT